MISVITLLSFGELVNQLCLLLSLSQKECRGSDSGLEWDNNREADGASILGSQSWK